MAPGAPVDLPALIHRFLAAGHTHTELAQLSGVEVRTIYRIKNGEVLPQKGTRRALLYVLLREGSDGY